MEITEVKIFPVDEEKLRAFVAIVIDGCFMVNDIKVIRGRSGLFISMPSRRKKNGDFKDIAHPLDSTTRRWLEQRILSSYEEAVNGGATEVTDVVAAESRPKPQLVTSNETVAQIDSPRPTEPLDDASLDEVQKRHLSDSFWQVS